METSGSVGRGAAVAAGAALTLGLAALAALAGPAAASGQEVVELPARDRELTASLEEVHSVGGAMTGAEWEIFGDLGGSSVAFDGRGYLYVFDRDNHRVVVADRDGGPVREFGRQGEGPDEWRSPISMTVLRDGTVVITDIGHRGYLVYGPDGELRETVSMAMRDGGFSVGSFQPDPRGGHLYSNAGGSFSVRVSTSGGPADVSPGRVVERLSLADGSKTPFFTAWEPPADDEPSVVRGGGATFRMAGGGPRAFEPRLRVGVLPDGGLAVVDSSAYAVKLVGPDGRLRRVARRPSVEPREVTGRVESRERERRLAELEAGDGPRMRVMVQGPGGGGARPVSEDQIREMQRSQVEQMRFYPEIPAVADLAAGWDGKIWVERTPADWWEDGPVDLLSPAGEYLGTLPAGGPGIPDAFGPDGLVAYVERDELDVATIRVRRLPAALR